MKIYFTNSIDPIIKKHKTEFVEFGKDMHYTINDTKVAKNAFSTGFHTCSGFDINAGGMNLVGHIKPEGFNPRNFAIAFERKVKEFQDKFGEITAFVFGGRESSYVDPFSSTTSNDVFATICDVLSSKCNIPDEKFLSVLGKFAKIKTNDDVAIVGDEVYFANKAIPKECLTMKDKEINNTLNSIYEWVDIATNMK